MARDLLAPALRWLVICGLAAYVLWPAPAGSGLEAQPPADTTAALEQLDAAASSISQARDRWAEIAEATAARQASIQAGIECGLSERTAVAVWEAERAYELPPGLLLAVIQLESECNEAEIGWNEASVDIGPAQINYTRSGINSTGPWLAREAGVNPLDPVGNVWAGAWYLRYHYDRHGSWQAALDAYNTGQPHETIYSRVVLARWGGE